MIINFVKKNTIVLSYEVETEEDLFIFTVSAEKVAGTKNVKVELKMCDPDKIMSHRVFEKMVACPFDAKSIEKYVRNYIVKNWDGIIEVYYMTIETTFSLLSGIKKED